MTVQAHGTPVTLQDPTAVVMVRPHRFGVNPETAEDNSLQARPPEHPESLWRQAYDEVTAAVATLRSAGVDVELIEDEHGESPDSVFPNNWFAVLPTGQLVLFPMAVTSRRPERRPDIVERVRERWAVTEVVDLTGLEDDGEFLEGTGALVLDHVARRAYAGRSGRATPGALAVFCAATGYEPVAFDAVDRVGARIYHTNVMMSIGAEVAVVATECIPDRAQRDAVLGGLRETGRRLVDISAEQVERFVGNCLEVALTGDRAGVVGGADAAALVLSATAVAALGPGQRATLENSARLVVLDVPTMELSGGSARCMLAGIHRPARATTPMAPSRATVP